MALASKYQVGVSTIYIYLKNRGIQFFADKKGCATYVRKEDVKDVDILELLKIDETAPKITIEIAKKMLNMSYERIRNIISKMGDFTKFGGRIYLTKEQVEWIRVHDKIVSRRPRRKHKKLKNDDSGERLKLLENKINRLLTELGVKIDDIKENRL